MARTVLAIILLQSGTSFLCYNFNYMRIKQINCKKGVANFILLLIIAILGGIVLTQRENTQNQKSDTSNSDNVNVLNSNITGTNTNTHTQSTITTSVECDLSVKISGGKFTPNECGWQIISGGPSCSPNFRDPCLPDHVLYMRDNTYSRGDRSHIHEISFFNFKELKQGTYYFNQNGTRDFNGQIIDENSIARNLVSGEIYVKPMDNNIKASIDIKAQFSNNINVESSGVVNVTREFAP